MKYGLEENTIEAIGKLLEAYPQVDKAYLFGSRAKGNFKPGSDIDLAMKGEGITYQDVVRIGARIDELADPLIADVLAYDSINEPALKEHIDRVGIEIYSRWREKPLDELVTFQRGHDLLQSDFEDGKYLVAGSNGPIGYHNKFTTKGPGITLGRSGNSIGVAHYYENDFWAHNTALYSKSFQAGYPKFIYYLLKGFDFKSFDSGSAVPSLNRNHIHSVKFNVPPLSEQKAIAETLSALDDKIDLLHRQNKTLEQLAETLFRQWFVEEAKEDWEVGKVEDLFILQRGYDLPTQHRTFGKYPIITASGSNGFHDQYKVEGPGVTTGRSGSLGAVFYVAEDFWPLNTSLYVKEYKIATPIYAYFFLKNLDLGKLNGGSAVPTLNRNDVHSIEVTLPPKKVVMNFHEQAKSYFTKIESNQSQIRTLTQLRDILLPKLMSGEVRVV